mmetsp:Transcript_35403/g.46604  ORF Transcript_35403/g.46604 Transcript_35403/m.46604 type:complete len:85 (+) Transcript_35403:388-642(+)
MLNSNISQTTQNAPAAGASTSAFGFMQNQSSLSISQSDNFAPPNPAKQAQPDIEEFEELSESREIIEDRIFRQKLQMIELTITQ